jgi:hypothetical protein
MNDSEVRGISFCFIPHHASRSTISFSSAVYQTITPPLKTFVGLTLILPPPTIQTERDSQMEVCE